MYQRSLIVAAGPFANFLLAIIIFAVINLFIGKDMTPAIIDEVKVNSPAFTAGLKKNDKILSINNKDIESILEVSTLVATSTSETISINILRNDQEISFKIKPEIVDGKDALGNSVKKKMIGIKLSSFNQEFNRVRLGPVKAFY